MHSQIRQKRASVAELVDALDSKSGVRKGLRVQVPSEVRKKAVDSKSAALFLYHIFTARRFAKIIRRNNLLKRLIILLICDIIFAFRRIVVFISLTAIYKTAYSTVLKQ